MSIALVQSIEELLITAATRLVAEIKAETNPKRLETLLRLAFQARIPRTLSTPAPTEPPPHAPLAPTTTPSTSSSPSTLSQTPRAGKPATSECTTPMPDAEYKELERRIGFPEANRRRLIRAHLAIENLTAAADSS